MPSITPAAADVVRGGPAAHMRLFHGSRPLKRWRYVGVFCDELMVCAARFQVGFLKQSFWAVLCRADGRLRERTRSLAWRGAVDFVCEAPGIRDGAMDAGSGRLRVCDGGVLLDLVLQEAPGIQAVCAHGREEVWTRKQAGIPAHGTLAVVYDTAGYHARQTEWRWTAGVGETADGVALAWNLVAGVNDPPSGSERAVWLAGESREALPVRFAGDLSRIYC